MSKKTPYMVIISTRTGTTIRLTNPPASLPELLRFIQDIELADIRAQHGSMNPWGMPLYLATDTNVPVPQEVVPAPVPEELPVPQEPAAQEKEEEPEEEPADPRRSRFVTLF